MKCINWEPEEICLSRASGWHSFPGWVLLDTWMGGRTVHQAAQRRLDYGQAVAKLEKKTCFRRGVVPPNYLWYLATYIPSPYRTAAKGKQPTQTPKLQPPSCSPNLRQAHIPAPQNRENSSKGKK